jgi:ABC-type multidrug transport system ATPase subunit
MRVQNLARKGVGIANSAAKATDILVATRLWDVRHSAVADLTPSQTAACELIEPLASGADLIVIDGQLDRLDPWTLRVVLDYLGTLRGHGAAFVIATNRPDLIGAFDAVVVLKDLAVRFAGTVDDLVRSGPPHTLNVATENRPGVQALVAPFEVSVRETQDGVRLEAAEGQSLAARLLLEGYGDVKFVVIRPPTVEEALLSLM